MISSPIIILHHSTAVSNYTPVVVLKYRIIRIRIIIKTFFHNYDESFSNLGFIMITELKVKYCMMEELIDQYAVRVK